MALFVIDGLESELSFINSTLPQPPLIVKPPELLDNKIWCFFGRVFTGQCVWLFQLVTIKSAC